MYNAFKPIHAVVIAFVLGVLGTSAVVLATSSTGYEPGDQGALAVTATFVRNTLYDGDDGPPRSSPPATPIAQLMPLEPVNPEPPLPLPEEPRRGCDEIREAGTYLNDAEREFFLDECLTDSPILTPARSVVSTAALSEAERAYQVKAEGIAHSHFGSLQRYSPAELTEDEAALVEYGARAGGWANQINNFEPVPARYIHAHQRLQVALWEIDAHARLLVTGEAEITDEDFAAEAARLVEGVNAAVAGYFEVLGLSRP